MTEGAFLGPVLLVLGPVAIGCLIAAAGYWFARKSGLGPLQAEYTKTLEALNRTLDDKLAAMQEQLDVETAARKALALRFADLEAENQVLRGQLQAVTDARVAALVAENARLRELHQ